MNPIETIKAAYERLADVHDEDPRSPLMRSLSALIDAAGDVPTGEIHLCATVAPGGVFEVRDQHGRPVAGVKSVAVFPDQSGSPVFQVSL
jgi:hypothetical protein